MYGVQLLHHALVCYKCLFISRRSPVKYIYIYSTKYLLVCFYSIVYRMLYEFGELLFTITVDFDARYT